MKNVFPVRKPDLFTSNCFGFHRFQWSLIPCHRKGDIAVWKHSGVKLDQKGQCFFLYFPQNPALQGVRRWCSIGLGFSRKIFLQPAQKSLVGRKQRLSVPWAGTGDSRATSPLWRGGHQACSSSGREWALLWLGQRQDGNCGIHGRCGEVQSVKLELSSAKLQLGTPGGAW